MAGAPPPIVVIPPGTHPGAAGTVRAAGTVVTTLAALDTGGAISHILHGSDVTISDPTLPTVTVEASGLLAGGSANGSDPVTVTASDNSGIQKVELLDVSSPAAPCRVPQASRLAASAR